MKWIVIALGSLVLLVVGALLYFPTLGNPRVAAELRAAPNGERAQKVMLLTLPSGRALPVNYLREGGVVYAGADGRWWRELRGEGKEVDLVVLGETLRGRARAIEGDPARTRDVFRRLRPNAPSWLPDWLNGVLVEIVLLPTR
jgi:hypothetical protein